MTGVLISREDTQRHRQEVHVTMEVENGAMQLETKAHEDRRELQKLGRGQGRLFSGGFRGSVALPTP